MNIEDIKDEVEMPANVWKAIFDKQKEIALKYAEIEKMGDLLQTTSINPDTANGQKWIKDFAWRFVEELTESEEARRMILSPTTPEIREENAKMKIHQVEELIDALHFLTELTIIADADERIVNYHVNNKFDFDADKVWIDIVYNLGCMCNTLKNKPWKQTQMLTDRIKFYGYLQAVWDNFMFYLRAGIGLSEEDIYNFYFKKNEVNKFRIRSKY